MLAPPPVDRVHVWTISPEEAVTPGRLEQYRALLTPEEVAENALGRCAR